MEIVLNVFALIGVVVTAATTIVVALEKVAEVTPTTKDDKAVVSAKRFLGKVSAILDPINVYLTKDKK